MRSLALHILVALVASTLAASHAARGRSPRIVGGADVVEGQYPFMVSLQQDNLLLGQDHVCGGTILNPTHILTSASCTKPITFANNLHAVAGNIDIGHRNPDEQDIRAAAFIEHDFTTTTGANDLSIIRLESPLTLVPGVVEVVPLPVDWQEPGEGTSCTSIGWGYTQVGTGGTSDVLQFVDMPYYADNTCQAYYPDTPILLDFICAGWEGGKGECTGDGGGPLICDGVQLGISSFSNGCVETPSVFMQVSHYLDWIAINSQEV